MCFQKNIKLAQWRSWRRRRRRRLVVPETIRPKKGRTCITTLWCQVHDHLAKLFIIRQELLVFLGEMSHVSRVLLVICQLLLVFFGEMNHVLLQGQKPLSLGARYWLRALNGWDTTGRSQVLDRSVGEPVHLIFIRSTGRSYLHPQILIEIRMGRRIVPISLPQPAIISLLKIEKEIIIFNSIKIITYEIKWLKEHAIKCWAQLSTNYCTPFWRSSLCTCVSTSSSIGLSSCPKNVACKKKIN